MTTTAASPVPLPVAPAPVPPSSPEVGPTTPSSSWSLTGGGAGSSGAVLEGSRVAACSGAGAGTGAGVTVAVAVAASIWSSEASAAIPPLWRSGGTETAAGDFSAVAGLSLE